MAKQDDEVRKLAREYSADAVRALAGIASDTTVAADVRTLAATALIEHGAGPPGPTVSEAGQSYVAENMRDPRTAWHHRTRQRHETIIRLFTEAVEDAPLASVTGRDVAAFMNTLATLSPRRARGRHAVNLSLSYLVERYTAEEGERLADTTLNKYLTDLSGLFTWARAQAIYNRENPCAGLYRRYPQKFSTRVKPFDIDELNTVFRGSLYAGLTFEQRTRPYDHDWKSTVAWIFPILLFSGLRTAEACQLRVDDIRREAGIWYFDINDRNTRRLKTRASIRKVPVHSELLRCGLLDYLSWMREHPSGRLFPYLPPGSTDQDFYTRVSLRLRNYALSLGLTGERSFRSLRKNFGTALERARIPESEAAQVLGHKKIGITYSVYSLGLDLSRLHEVIESVRYEGLDLTGLHDPLQAEKPRAPATDPSEAVIGAVAALRRRVLSRWKVPPGTPDLVLTVCLRMASGGWLRRQPEIKEVGGLFDPTFRALAAGLVRALNQSMPLRSVPRANYETWRELELIFSTAEAGRE